MWVTLIRRMALAGMASLVGGASMASDGAPVPTTDRQAKLVRMVRQDCGSCHGMRLTGGLWTALTPDQLRDWPVSSLVAVILHGRPGTPMPGWKAMLSEADARWIAMQLQAGFPEETNP